MEVTKLIDKGKRKIWGKIVGKRAGSSTYMYLYRSYWHSLIRKNKTLSTTNLYFTARPNPGAGIGHQMANWIAGYWFAQLLNISFAHVPFSNEEWEVFLGFGNDEVKVQDLLSKGYSKVLLPLFDENNRDDLRKIQQIVASYSGNKVVFVCEQDQYYHDQYGLISIIQDKFYNASSRRYDKLLYSQDCLNIAIHVRRGDIVIGQYNNDEGLTKRWLDNDYFIKVLLNVLAKLKTSKPIQIYLFSQGVEADFLEFKRFSNLTYCLDMNAKNSFLHMVYADILITSKSSFSYKPALINKGTKVCPRHFWHGYPNDSDWILSENDGTVNVTEIIA